MPGTGLSEGVPAGPASSGRDCRHLRHTVQPRQERLEFQLGEDFFQFGQVGGAARQLVEMYCQGDIGAYGGQLVGKTDVFGVFNKFAPYGPLDFRGMGQEVLHRTVFSD